MQTMTLLLAALLASSLHFPHSIHSTAKESIYRNSLEEPLQEMAHIGQWWLQHERDGLNAFDDAEFEKRFIELLAELGVDFSLEVDQIIEQVITQIERAFKQHNPEALPLIALFQQPEAVEETWTQLGALQLGLQNYQKNLHSYPSSIDGLEALLIADGEHGPYVSSSNSLDGWGRKFQYESLSESTFQLRSLGPDGVAHTQDDLLGNELGPFNEAPANASSQITETCGIPRFAYQGKDTFVELVVTTRYSHWDLSLVVEEQSIPAMDRQVLLSIDGFEGSATLFVEEDGWVQFQANPQILEDRLRAGLDSQVFRFYLIGTSGSPPGMYLGLDWALDIVEANMEDDMEVQLAHWADILSAVPDTETGVQVRLGISTRMESKQAKIKLDKILVQWEERLASHGGLDPITREARQECMHLQTQLGESLLANGEPQAAIEAFGNAARHASDNDDLDALEARIQQQLDAHGSNN